MNPIPRISTRGYYDLTDGSTVKSNRYFLYPKQEFAKIVGANELTIMIHGLRNNKAGAVVKAEIAKKRLRQLGYKHPVVGYSYDSNTKGAHLRKYASRALAAGQKIAIKNGRNLALFIQDFKGHSPNTKIRLIGHSLGSQVILSTAEYLARKKENQGIIESAYLFGASITNDVPSSKKYQKILDKMISKKIVNYYYPGDEVLGWAEHKEYVKGPLGLNGAAGKPLSKYQQIRVKPKNHRFASYASTLKKFP